MSLAIINTNTYAENINMENHQALDAHRRQIIKRKVLAIGKMSRSYTVLKEHPELVKQLKSFSVNGKLPVGTLATGEQGIREAIIASAKTDFKLKEQKDLSSYHVAASPNYKVASREGHA
ncbi:uncharacterized protein EV154DRAFT_505991 [Mucor mucedo]|uniref:uncharacterized protein n=1 Tax=Mucor mucedo TaxID=29922 RepID=UPI002220A8DF|nr:uncharacterized protein EV154DRAFT_505991 [Mucor mucedo]KAI7892198.1 hypothetical protein EV154DRAFT_505991 [Mucor mucedo]